MRQLKKQVRERRKELKEIETNALKRSLTFEQNFVK